MIKLYIASALMLLSNSLLAQYCTSGVGPTSLIDSNIESVNLVGDVGVINYTGCPGMTGVEDQTNQSVTLTAGSNYTLNVQFGTCGGNYNGAGEAWIDFNGNQVFDLNESIGTWQGSPPTAASVFNFTVPVTVSNLPVRLRVMQREQTSVLPLDPCGTYSWGSVVDFTVNFTGGIDCSTYVGNDETDPRLVPNLPFTENYDNSICYTNNNPVYNSADVYYLVTPQAGTQEIIASLCGSSFDTYISAFDTQGNVLAFNDDACGPQSEITINVQNVDSVYVIVEGWGIESGPYTINIFETSAAIEKNSKKTIKLYPNPTTNSFKINNVLNGTLSILDLNGKEIYINKNYNGETILVNDYPNGIYIVKIMVNDIIYTEKLIIQ